MWVFVYVFRDMRIDKYLTGDQFVFLMEILMISFFAANVLNRVSDKWSGNFGARRNDD